MVDVRVAHLTDKLIGGSVGGDDVVGPPFQHGLDDLYDFGFVDLLPLKIISPCLQVVKLTGCFVACLKADGSPSHLCHGSRHGKSELDKVAGWKEQVRGSTML